MSKAKGTRAERELFHLFWKNNFAAIRSAGSGSTTMPAPDILAGNKNKLLAIECKSIKNNKQYFPKKEIQELFEFSDKINAKPFIGMRFDNHGWFFLNAKKLINIYSTIKSYFGGINKNVSCKIKNKRICKRL